MQIDNGGVGQRDGGSSSKLSQQPDKSEGQGTTRALLQLHVPDGTDPKENASDMVTELEPDDGGVEHPDVECMIDRATTCTEEVTKVVAHDRVNLLAAIPEASPPSHRSKRRAENADQTNLKWVEKMKANHNLDASFDQGNTDSAATSFLHFSKEHVVDNLELIGITLGKGESEVCKAVERIKCHENDRRVEKVNIDEASKKNYQEEKDLAEEEEVDKLILNSLCCEIMDEVVDLDSAYPSYGKTIPRKKSP
jgi:hypothetical protein